MSSKLILRITKIGELLERKRISDSDNNHQIDCVNLKIPDYQRPYKWTAKNANQLLDDILQAIDDKKDEYRVGTLILHYDKGFYNIVDGQQRIITFALLLKALKVDVDFLDQKLAKNDYNLHNVVNNYRTLVRRLNNSRVDSIRKFVEDNCKLIVVITNDLSEAFQFFDSQNSRGKALYPHDLLKAYHLREMSNVSAQETEEIVRIWENFNQRKLAELFSDYLYRLIEWQKGNRPTSLNNHIDIFKGMSAKDNFPYAQYFKGAYAYADTFNKSNVPFVTGGNLLKPFQINAPIIAGKAFFEYSKHYFDILGDIQNSDIYNIQNIVKTLNDNYNRRTGDKITRLMFDTAVLLYVDRFCPLKPDKNDMEFLDSFVKFAFVWAYSMRAQYQNVGWTVAQNYIMAVPRKEIVNSLNIYKLVAESFSPNSLLSALADLLIPLKISNINKKNIDDKNKNYLAIFKELKYLEE